MKVRVPPGPARAEVMQLVDIFRARVVDVSEKTITLAVTGDAGKASLSPLTNIDAHMSLQQQKSSSLPLGAVSKSVIKTLACQLWSCPITIHQHKSSPLHWGCPWTQY